MTTGRHTPYAVVLGARGIEVVRALRAVRVPCALVTGRGDPARWSRHTRTLLDWDWMEPLDHHDAALADRLVRLAPRLGPSPVLICCSDQPMVFVSRHRERLAEAYRFSVADPDLVETTLDKARFAEFARARRLPVPSSVVLPTDLPDPPESATGLRYPIIVKPTVRDRTWLRAAEGNAKAVRLDSATELGAMWPRIRALSGPALAQECIEGGECEIRSYHTYVDRDGLVAGEFTGRKIRTLPAAYGHTSALTVTHDPAVIAAGRKVADAVGLRGVAKIDFKRAADGRLYLLEINARFTLWAHPGARAGVNLPGLVHADLTGRPRPGTSRFRDVDWVHPKDAVAAHRAGVPLRTWVPWALTRPTKGVWSWEDPLPFAGLAAHYLQGHRSGDREGLSHDAVRSDQ